MLDEEEVRFEVLEKGSKRGGALLVSTDGFSYGIRVRTIWYILKFGFNEIFPFFIFILYCFDLFHSFL